jgi:hypothetical protein
MADLMDRIYNDLDYEKPKLSPVFEVELPPYILQFVIIISVNTMLYGVQLNDSEFSGRELSECVKAGDWKAVDDCMIFLLA